MGTRRAKPGHPEQRRSPKALVGSADHSPEVWGELLPFRSEQDGGGSPCLLWAAEIGRGSRAPTAPGEHPRPGGASPLDQDGTGMEEGAQTTSLSHNSEFKDVFALLCCDIGAYWGHSGLKLSSSLSMVWMKPCSAPRKCLVSFVLRSATI